LQNTRPAAWGSRWSARAVCTAGKREVCRGRRKASALLMGPVPRTQGLLCFGSPWPQLPSCPPLKGLRAF